MIIEKIVTEFNELDITGATLLSKEEYEKYKGLIPLHGYWWLRSPARFGNDYADGVNNNDVMLYFRVNHILGVIPALTISNLNFSNFEIGDKFKLSDHSFTIISEKYALCDNIIGKCSFRKDWHAKDANDYEASDVKKYIDEWFSKIAQQELNADKTAEKSEEEEEESMEA